MSRTSSHTALTLRQNRCLFELPIHSPDSYRVVVQVISAQASVTFVGLYRRDCRADVHGVMQSRVTTVAIEQISSAYIRVVDNDETIETGVRRKHLLYHEFPQLRSEQERVCWTALSHSWTTRLRIWSLQQRRKGT